MAPTELHNYILYLQKHQNNKEHQIKLENITGRSCGLYERHNNLKIFDIKIHGTEAYDSTLQAMRPACEQ